jgi:hypothetical protein
VRLASAYVEDDGRYYLVEPVESDRRPTGWGWKTPSGLAVEAMRLATWIGGVAALWRASGPNGAGAQRRAETREERLR